MPEVHKQTIISDKQNLPLKQWARSEMPKFNTRTVYSHLLQTAKNNVSRDDFLLSFLQYVATITKSLGAVYFARSSANQLAVGPQLLSKELLAATPDAVARVSDMAMQCAQQGFAEIHELTGTDLNCCVVPVNQQRMGNEVLVTFVDNQQAAIEQNMLTAQLMCGYVNVWHQHRENNLLEHETIYTAALLELTTLLQATDSQDELELKFVNEFRKLVACDKVALGQYAQTGEILKLKSVSALSEIDKRSNYASLIEQCFFEVNAFQETIVWSTHNEQTEQDQHNLFVAHQRLAEQMNARTVVSFLLHDSQQQVVAAVTCWWQGDSSHIKQKIDFINAAAKPLGITLQRSEEKKHPLFKVAENSIWFKYKQQILVGSAIFVLLLLFLPVKHKISADVQLEPITQRVVAASYDGVLNSILAKPGDKVQQGDILAKLDEREIAWKMKALKADYQRARKNRDMKLVGASTSEAQIATLEIQRIGLKIKLLQNQMNNLDIVAPISGVIISGDIEQKQGSPVTKGQALFEVAPLDKMTAELYIPADDISYVKQDAPLLIKFDALPGKSWRAKLESLQPRAIIKDNENVFLGRVQIDHDEIGLFKPGMQGQAKLLAGRRSLGWVWFHKAWHRLSRWFLMAFSSPA